MGIGQTMMDSLSSTVSSAVAPFQSPPEGQPESNPVSRAAEVTGGALGLISLPGDLLDTGFAVATNAIAQALPSFPAATMGMLYVGPPHPHAHPPSLIPPNPVPIPLPSLGPISMGVSLQVLINGMPAARAGDIGFAFTCCGFAPIFEIWLGSSKVFIGGSRAARMLDLCKACQLDVMGALDMVMEAAGVAITAMTAVGEGIEALSGGEATEADPAAAEAAAAMAAAHGIAAAANAAQAVADAAALAVKAAMGSDPSLLPLPGPIVAGHPNVLIGGFPTPDLMDLAMKMMGKLLKKLKRKRKTPDKDHKTKKG